MQSILNTWKLLILNVLESLHLICHFCEKGFTLLAIHRGQDLLAFSRNDYAYALGWKMKTTNGSCKLSGSIHEQGSHQNLTVIDIIEPQQYFNFLPRQPKKHKRQTCPISSRSTTLHFISTFEKWLLLRPILTLLQCRPSIAYWVPSQIVQFTVQNEFHWQIWSFHLKHHLDYTQIYSLTQFFLSARFNLLS